METNICELNIIPSRDSYSLRAVRSGDQTLVGARFSAPAQTSPGAHPAPSTKVTGSFPGESGRVVALTTHPHLEPRLKKEQSYTSTPPLGLRAMF